jgi:hypothetical protein
MARRSAGRLAVVCAARVSGVARFVETAGAAGVTAPSLADVVEPVTWLGSEDEYAVVSTVGLADREGSVPEVVVE